MADAFKAALSEALPESLFQQVEPHIDKILDLYDAYKHMAWQDESEACGRIREIRAEFDNANAHNWPAFARERWPEIDKHFNIKHTFDDKDDLPF